MASVALDLRLFRETLFALLPLFSYSVRDNGPLICCHTDATNATIATRGLGMGNIGGIRVGLNATRDATAPRANATLVRALPSYMRRGDAKSCSQLRKQASISGFDDLRLGKYTFACSLSRYKKVSEDGNFRDE